MTPFDAPADSPSSRAGLFLSPASSCPIALRAWQCGTRQLRPRSVTFCGWLARVLDEGAAYEGHGRAQRAGSGRKDRASVGLQPPCHLSVLARCLASEVGLSTPPSSDVGRKGQPWRPINLPKFWPRVSHALVLADIGARRARKRDLEIQEQKTREPKRSGAQRTVCQAARERGGRGAHAASRAGSCVLTRRRLAAGAGWVRRALLRETRRKEAHLGGASENGEQLRRRSERQRRCRARPSSPRRGSSHRRGTR